jgi:hypothetical protein
MGAENTPTPGRPGRNEKMAYYGKEHKYFVERERKRDCNSGS